MDSLREKATRQHTRGHNSRLVLGTIYDYGEISRASLARLTRLTRTTVSEVVAELIERGLVEEVGQGAVAVGRTPILLSVADDARQAVALNITNDEVTGALVNLRGGLRQIAQRPLSSRDGAGLLAAAYSLADDLVREATRPLLGIGVNTPGLVDTATGTVLRAVNFGWKDLPLRALLQERYGLPVYVANDSHTLALAEYMFGQERGSPNLVVIKVGQGIGAGIILNGHLFSGEGYGAGEIGHLMVEAQGELCKCGNRGCLETVASVGVLLRRARGLAQSDAHSALGQLAADGAALTVDHVAQAARAGDPAVQALIADIGRYLAIGVATLVGVLNLRRVVIAGRMAGLGDLLRDAVCAELNGRALPALVRDTLVEVVSMAPEAPLLGAVAPLLTYELGLLRLQRRA